NEGAFTIIPAEGACLNRTLGQGALSVIEHEKTPNIIRIPFLLAVRIGPFGERKFTRQIAIERLGYTIISPNCINFTPGKQLPAQVVSAF
ncbi:MAG: hypothetical protein ACKVG0_06700, partial [Alphaproteobacteria bacterium]